MKGWWIVESFTEKDGWYKLPFAPSQGSLREAIRFGKATRNFNPNRPIRVRNTKSNTWMML